MVRVLEGGKKLMGAAEDFYDKALAKYVTGDFSKAYKIIGQFLAKEKTKTSDVFLTWRLKVLIDKNGWETRGHPDKTTRDFEVRNPAMPSLRKKAEQETEEPL
jgi:hypothetical protein